MKTSLLFATLLLFGMLSAEMNYPAITLANQSFCDNFGDGGSCDHGYNANWVQIATMEGATFANLTYTTRVSNDTTNYKEGAQGFRLDAIPTGAANGSDPYLAIPITDLTAFTNITLWIYQPTSNNISNLWVNFHDTNNSNQFKFRLDASGLNRCPSAGWCFVNVLKASPSLTTGSPSWAHITAIEMYVTANTSGNAWATFDDLRAVGASGQFNDTMENRIQWTPVSGYWEIQNTTYGKVAVDTNATTGVLQANTTCGNCTIYVSIIPNTARPYNGLLIGSKTFYTGLQGTGDNATFNSVSLGASRCKALSVCDQKIIINGNTLTLYQKNSTDTDFVYIGASAAVETSIKTVGIRARESPASWFNNILIQEHIHPAVNTTDNSGTFTREQSLECSALTNSSDGETVCDWYQNGMINQTAKRMVAYYPFDAPYSNSTFTQDMAITPTANATVSGATWTSNGKIGGAYSFDGVNDAINISDNVKLNFSTGDYTISVWVKTGITDTNARQIIRKKGTGAGDGYDLYYQSNNIYSRLDGTTASYLMPSLANNEWHQITTTASRATLTLSIFVDGTYRANASINLTQSASYSDILSIGAYPGGQYWNGSIDDVRIYNQSLTADEIGQIYREGMLGKQLISPQTLGVYQAIMVGNTGAYQTQNTTLYAGFDAFVNFTNPVDDLTTDRISINLTNFTNGKIPGYMSASLNYNGVNYTPTATYTSNSAYFYADVTQPILSETNTSDYVYSQITKGPYDGNAYYVSGIGPTNTPTWKKISFANIDKTQKLSVIMNVTTYAAAVTGQATGTVNMTNGTDMIYITRGDVSQGAERTSTNQFNITWDGNSWNVTNGTHSLSVESSGTLTMNFSVFASTGATYSWASAKADITAYGSQAKISWKIEDSSVGVSYYFNNSTTVIPVLLSNCSNTSHKRIATFTFYDQNNPTTIINSTMEASFTLKHTSSVSKNISLSFTTPQKNASLCVVYDGAYNIDSTQTFSSPGYRNLYYYLINSSLSTYSPANISLYNLNESISTATNYVVLQGASTPVENAYVQILRYYPSNDQLLLVSMGKTNTQGIASSYAIPNDITYRYIIIKDGQIVFTSGVTTLPCDPSLTLCSSTIYISSAVTNEYLAFVNSVGVGCWYNNATYTISCTTNNPSGTGTDLNLQVREIQTYGTVLVCDQNLSSASGTVSCVLDPTKAYDFRGTAIMGGQAYIIGSGGVNIRNTDIVDKNIGLFGTILFICVGALAGLFAGFGATLIGAILGLILAVILKFIVIDLLILVPVTIIALVLAWILRG